ncbi:MAG: UDP-N-acetylmuramate dehydrogenase [Gammaproteobacteria bacterium]|nr:UDP-N-acetylmuramate dehydrogenase [Gammaproteobacteria bacterium]
MNRPASLVKYNTLGVDSTARELIHVADKDELLAASSNEETCIYLGGGSNVVLLNHLDARVIRVEIKGIFYNRLEDGSNLLRVGAGECWHELVRATVGKGLRGLENLALIPGSVGAAPCQNISAYGRELSEVLHSVEVFDRFQNSFQTIPNEQCRFRYRDSLFKSYFPDRYVICYVNLVLGALELSVEYKDVKEHLEQWPVHALSSRAIAESVVRVRKRKLPEVRSHGNVGSFFQNPTISRRKYDWLRAKTEIRGFDQSDGVRVPAARLIEVCGWKGRRIGDVQVWHRQPLVLVNRGTAKGSDFLELAKRIAGDVHSKFDIELALEPIVLGQDS